MNHKILWWSAFVEKVFRRLDVHTSDPARTAVLRLTEPDDVIAQRVIGFSGLSVKHEE